MMKTIGSILILLLMISSCDRFNDNIKYSKYITGSSIESDIKFFPIEVYENYYEVDTADLKIRFHSTKMFPHSTNPILTSSYIDNNELIIRFESIQESGMATTPGPAVTSIELPENIERLALINGSIVDQYIVDVTKEYVELKASDQDFSQLKYDKIFRYPENSFLYQCQVDTSNTRIFNDFLNILVENLSISEFQFDGEGRKPYTEDWQEGSKICLTKYFEYESELEFEKADKLLEDFTSRFIEPNTGTSIRLISWNNKRHLSWMYDR